MGWYNVLWTTKYWMKAKKCDHHEVYYKIFFFLTLPSLKIELDRTKKTSFDGSKVSWALLWRFVWSSSKYVTKLPHTSHSFTSLYTFYIKLSTAQNIFPESWNSDKRGIVLLTNSNAGSYFSEWLRRQFGFNNVKLDLIEFEPDEKNLIRLTLSLTRVKFNIDKCQLSFQINMYIWSPELTDENRWDERNESWDWAWQQCLLSHYPSVRGQLILVWRILIRCLCIEERIPLANSHPGFSGPDVVWMRIIFIV